MLRANELMQDFRSANESSSQPASTWWNAYRWRASTARFYAPRREHAQRRLPRLHHADLHRAGLARRRSPFSTKNWSVARAPDGPPMFSASSCATRLRLRVPTLRRSHPREDRPISSITMVTGWTEPGYPASPAASVERQVGGPSAVADSEPPCGSSAPRQPSRKFTRRRRGDGRPSVRLRSL
jgi:hypothetical protein